METTNSTKSHLYFAYGSNLSPTQMKDRCAGATRYGIGVINDWEFRIGHRGVATIISSPGAQAWGGLWNVTADHIAALDEFEGVGHGIYERKLVEVHVGGESVEAIVYIEPFECDGTPRSGYLERILDGAHWFQLPDSYIANLMEVGV